MTRGILIVLANNTIYTSTEFNGDMYPTGAGELAIQALRDLEVTSKKNISRMFQYVNREGDYNYPKGAEVYEAPLSEDEEGQPIASLKSVANTDYAYIKNMTGEPVKLKLLDNRIFVLNNDCIAILHFGEFLNAITPDGSLPVSKYYEYTLSLRFTGPIEAHNAMEDSMRGILVDAKDVLALFGELPNSLELDPHNIVMELQSVEDDDEEY